MLRLIDLFSGAGGMTLGFCKLSGAAFEPVWALDFNRDAVGTYRANFGPHCVCADAVDVLEKSLELLPRADVVVGGPPCQGTGNVGAHIPNDPRNQLWRQFTRCVASVRPAIYAMENVPSLLRSEEYAELRRLAEAEPSGYQVAGQAINAADHGIARGRLSAA